MVGSSTNVMRYRNLVGGRGSKRMYWNTNNTVRGVDVSGRKDSQPAESTR